MMPTLDEIATGQRAPAAAEERTDSNEANADQNPERMETNSPSGLLEWLLSPTGDGELSDYLTHPLNWDGTDATARIVRGITGLCGNLRLALVDIAVGILQKMWRKQDAPAT